MSCSKTMVESYDGVTYDAVTYGEVYSGDSSDAQSDAQSIGVEPQGYQDYQDHTSIVPQDHAPPKAESESLSSRALSCLVIVVLTVVTAVAVAINRDRLILLLGSISVDPSSPKHGLMFILAGLALFAVQFIGVSWWTFTTSYFFRYPAIGLCLLTTMTGITMNFALGRGLKSYNYKPDQLSSSAPSPSGTSSFDKLIRHIELKPFKFASLAFCTPVPVPMLCTLLGLSTEVGYPTVLCAGTLIVMLQSLPIVFVAASAASLVDAFANPVNAISTLVTLVAAVGLTFALSVYVKREMDGLDTLVEEEDCMLLGHTMSGDKYEHANGRRAMAPWPVFALTEDINKETEPRRCCSRGQLTSV